MVCIAVYSTTVLVDLQCICCLENTYNSSQLPEYVMSISLYTI